MTQQQHDNIWQYIRPWFRRGKRFLEAISQPLFYIRGKPPHYFGYNWYKQREIIKAIKSDFTNDLPDGYGIKIDERIVEYPWFLSRISAKSERLLDAGSALNHRFLLTHPSLNNKEITISTLAPESDAWWRRGISYVYEDFRFSCFRNEYFDSIACISTLEHVGLDNTMLYTGDSSKKENTKADAEIVMSEFRRMLRPGGKLYITFPYGKHLNFGWFQVFDAAGVELLANSFKPTYRIDNYYKYTINGWKKCAPEDLVETDYFDPHTAKISKAADGAAGARGLACLEWTV